MSEESPSIPIEIEDSSSNVDTPTDFMTEMTPLPVNNMDNFSMTPDSQESEESKETACAEKKVKKSVGAPKKILDLKKVKVMAMIKKEILKSLRSVKGKERRDVVRTCLIRCAKNIAH